VAFIPISFCIRRICFSQYAKIEEKGEVQLYCEIVRLRLANERKTAGYTQQKLAEHTGLDDSLIAKIEAGHRKPDVETVGILASFFGISTDYLYGLGQKNNTQH
jgi:ribosome-binding protein aMBF1 (putative translation factor)